MSQVLISSYNHIKQKRKKKIDRKSVFSYGFKIPIAANCTDVCLQNKSKYHSFHLKIWHFL